MTIMVDADPIASHRAIDRRSIEIAARSSYTVGILEQCPVLLVK